NPKANASKTTNSSTPTNAPTTSPKPSDRTTANPTFHPCVTVSPWPAACGHMSPEASLNRPRPTPARASPAPDAKPSPRWEDAEAKPPSLEELLTPKNVNPYAKDGKKLIRNGVLALKVAALRLQHTSTSIFSK